MPFPLSRTGIGLLLTLGSAAFFGVYPAAARYAYADGANATFVMLLTTTVRMLAFCLFCAITRKALFATKTHTLHGAIGGFFQTVSIVGIFGALVFIPGPVMIIIVFSHTLMLLLYMAWRGEVRLDAVTLGSTLLAMLGLTLVLDLWGQSANYSWLGMGLAFMSALATAVRFYVYGREMQTRNPAIVGAENFVFSVVLLIPIGLLFPSVMPHSMAGLSWAMVGAITQALATFCMFYGLAALGAFRFSLFLKLEPIFTAVFAVLIIHEVLAMHQYLGIVIVLASLLAYQYSQARRKPVPTTAIEP